MIMPLVGTAFGPPGTSASKNYASCEASKTLSTHKMLDMGNVDKFNKLTFSTRENKTADLTEYYNLMYQYKNDCLAASVEYNKEYYEDRDIKPSENIFFKLTIIPFGEASSPNLKN